MKKFNQDLIDQCLANKDWDLGNEILYKMCKDHFEHDQTDKIIAKAWIIGRSYSVALERFKKTEKDLVGDTFYTKTITDAFKNSNIDFHLIELKNYRKIKSENLLQSLKVHKYLTDKLSIITRQNKRSFCSKYLHFHLPELFFIYDSIAQKNLAGFKVKISEDLKDIVNSNEVDNEYADFSCKCLTFKSAIENEYSLILSNRDVDKILLYYKHEDTENGES